MKTNIWKLLFLLLILPAAIQAQVDFTKADSIANSIITRDITLEDLAKQLSETLESDTEKARAIYMWVAGNIRYDCRKYRMMGSSVEFSGYSLEEIQQKRAAYLEKNLQRTLKLRRGVCEDYSRLYMALGEAAGLEVTLITGNARDFNKPYRKTLGESHAWNAVKLEGQWYLIDATWAAGSTNAEVTRFKSRLSSAYFMVAPEVLIQTHFPKDPKWQLLPEAIDNKMFAALPMVNIAEVKFGVEDFSPTMETRGNKRIIRLKFTNLPKYFMVTTRKSKPITFKKRLKDGYMELEISKSTAKKIIVWVGTSTKRMNWVAMYKA